jgi:hypothetical protein
MTVRRVKSYTGQTGFVYQYYYVGNREVDGATEYIFDVTADRKSMFAVSIFLKKEALASWSAVHGRALTGTEQYAAAKLRLFQAFDEQEKMKEQGRTLSIDSGNLEELLSQLELD